MLAELRGVSPDRARGQGELRGDSELAVGAPALVHQIDHHSPGAGLGVIHDLGKVQHRLTAAIHVLKERHPFRTRFLGEKRGDLMGQRFLVGARLEIAGLVPVDAAHRFAERFPELGLEGSESHVLTVTRLIDVVAGIAVIQKVVARGGGSSVCDELSPAEAVPRHGPVGHGNVDELPHPRPLTGQ